MTRPAFILFFFVVFAVGPYQAVAADETSLSEQNNLKVRVLNAEPRSVDMAAVEKASTRITKLFSDGKLEMMRVMIFAEHSIVKDALADKTIEITIASPKSLVILVPIAQRGKFVIVREKEATRENYAVYSLPADAGVDLAACLKN